MTRGAVVWFTGLSGAGKSTIARATAEALRRRGERVEVLDGDEVRENLSRGLGFSKADRDENILRIAYVARVLARSGAIAVVAAISPYREARLAARNGVARFVEVHVDCPLDELVRRDTKGLYAKALRGELPNFTGVSDPYEAPQSPEVHLDTSRQAVDECMYLVLQALDESLVDRVARAEERAELRERAASLPSVRLGARQRSDLELLAVGAFSPLDGFLGRADYESVVARMRLADGRAWPLPVTLPVSKTEAAQLREGGEVALRDDAGGLLGLLELGERYVYDKEREARLVYGTTESAHPGVAALREQGEVLLAGRVTVLEPPDEARFGGRALPPAATRAKIRERGWKTVVGFQTRNPVHRAHEYLQKCALEISDGLLLHPLVGPTKDDDIPAEIRLACYEALVAHYYPADRVLFSVLPATMRYGGPREAVFHALVRRNYGCTHFIVGRDHAGVGNYYDTYAAHRIFGEFGTGELGITPLFFEHAFYCRACDGMASPKTCPHDGEDRLALSGTKVRELLRAGALLPEQYTRREVAAILRDEVARHQKGGNST